MSGRLLFVFSYKLCISLNAYGFGGSLGIMLIYAIVLNLCLVALRVRRKCFTANYYLIFIFYDNNRILVSEEIAMGVRPCCQFSRHNFN